MTSPDTNLERQKRRHVGPLLGITIGLIAAAVFMMVFMGSDDPAPTETVLDTEVETETLAD